MDSLAQEEGKNGSHGQCSPQGSGSLRILTGSHSHLGTLRERDSPVVLDPRPVAVPQIKAQRAPLPPRLLQQSQSTPVDTHCWRCRRAGRRVWQGRPRDVPPPADPARGRVPRGRAPVVPRAGRRTGGRPIAAVERPPGAQAQARGPPLHDRARPRRVGRARRVAGEGLDRLRRTRESEGDGQ